MIPKYEEIQVPILKELSTGITLRAKDLHAPLAKHFGLTQNEINASRERLLFTALCNTKSHD